MAHNPTYRDYPVDADLKRIENGINTYVEHATWQEGGHGLVCPIRWLRSEPICANYEAAEKRIDELDRDDYDALAVRYYDNDVYRDPKLSPAYNPACIKASEAVNQAQKDYNELKDKSQAEFFARKSEFIGCKECGSKLSMKYLKKTNCPMCGSNLMSPTMTERLMKAHDRVVSAQKKRTEVYDKTRKKAEAQAKKNAKNCKVRWLVKFDYHT